MHVSAIRFFAARLGELCFTRQATTNLDRRISGLSILSHCPVGFSSVKRSIADLSTPSIATAVEGMTPEDAVLALWMFAVPDKTSTTPITLSKEELTGILKQTKHISQLKGRDIWVDLTDFPKIIVTGYDKRSGERGAARKALSMYARNCLGLKVPDDS